LFCIVCSFQHNRRLVAHGKISPPGSMFFHHTDPIELWGLENLEEPDSISYYQSISIPHNLATMIYVLIYTHSKPYSCATIVGLAPALLDSAFLPFADSRTLLDAVGIVRSQEVLPCIFNNQSDKILSLGFIQNPFLVVILRAKSTQSILYERTVDTFDHPLRSLCLRQAVPMPEGGELNCACSKRIGQRHSNDDFRRVERLDSHDDLQFPTWRPEI
jgi:hypothetical protein